MFRTMVEGYVVGEVRQNDTEKGRWINFGVSVRSENPKAEEKERQFANIELFVNKESKLPQYIVKGKRILVTNGRMYYEEAEGKDSVKRRYYKIRATSRDIALLGNGKTEENQKTDVQAAPANAAAPVEGKKKEDWE